MKNFVIRYGLWGGCLLIILGLLNWFIIAPLGYNASQVVGYLSIIIALLCIPLGIKYFRDKLNNGAVTFNQGFRIGLGITFITSVIMFFYSLLFFVIAGDEFLAWREAHLTEEELERTQLQLAQMPDFIMTPWFQGLVMFLTVFLIGLIINLISALALKKS
jgi:hypothetical protein